MAGMYQFYIDVYEVVDDPSLDSIISWSKSNKSFVIWNPEELIEKKIVSSSNLSHFITELNTHGFVRIMGSEHLEFGHEQYFVRGQPELLKKIHDQAAMAATCRVEDNRLVSDKPTRILHAKDLRIRYQEIFGSRIAKKQVENRLQESFVRGKVPKILNATDLRIRYQKIFGSRTAKTVVENSLHDNKVRGKVPKTLNATDLRIRYQKIFGSRIAKTVVENSLQDNELRGKVPKTLNATDLRNRFKKMMESAEVENGLQQLRI